MFSIAIHGGAGTISKDSMTPEKKQAYEKGLKDALDTGFKILESGGSSIDAVTAAVESLEDCILFNAGRGSVFDHNGTHEMDAAVMRGDTCEAGAVGAVSHIKNPVRLARLVMEHSPHVMLIGKGAEEFAKNENVAFESDKYFFSQMRYDQYQEALKDDAIRLDHSEREEKKFGTVGAVAIDENGNLAAATSTGGLTNKKFGRIGDSPIIGAGTYANNLTCAVSCTGDGEFFMRQVVAHQVHCLMLYKQISLQQAAEEVVLKDLVKIKGEGGLIAVDNKGEIAMVFNSEGMYRGMRNSDGRELIAIYK